MNPGYTFFYVEANVVCVIIFAILLIKNLNSVDRQEKQRIYDRVLVSSMMYFACDSFWAMIEGGSIPSTRLGVDIVNYGNSVILAFMTYYWFLYVEVSRGAKYMNKRRNRVYTMILAIISSVVMFILFAFFNDLVIDQDNETTLLYAIIFLSAPVVYILTSAIASFVRAAKKENYAVRTQYIIGGVYPIVVSVSGIVQTLALNAPLFCYGCTIMMIYVYVKSLDNMVSLDPLTNLNNRAQLKRYISNDLRMPDPGEKIFILMIDLNKFKAINDTYGHVEGDKAIVKAAEALKMACRNEHHRQFIARYGGDEFIVVAKLKGISDAEALKHRIKDKIYEYNEKSGAEYELRSAVGYAEYSGRIEDFQNAIKTADAELYEDKHWVELDLTKD